MTRPGACNLAHVTLTANRTHENHSMKVILCTGGPNSGHEHIFDVLVKAGVSRAQPASTSGFQPQKLQAEILRSYEVDLTGTAPLTQVLPGKLWTQLASGLFLANTSYPVWGWADHQTTVCMDFWQEFDPQVRILLVYQTPQAHLANVLDQHARPSLQAVSAALDQWVHWNTEVLRYYHRHSTRCSLVNSDQAIAQPQAFVRAIAREWQIVGLDLTSLVPSGNLAYGYLQRQLIDLLIDSQHPALALRQELDGTALLPSDASMFTLVDTIENVWDEWVGLRARLGELVRRTSDLTAACEVAETFRTQLDAQLAWATQNEKAAVELRQENELLLLQRDQLQEELEHYFLRCTELERKQKKNATEFTAAFWIVNQPTEIVVDMRQEVVGSNWYDAEADGRWAGPGGVSTIQLPPLQAAEYTLVLEVVDSMHPEIVSNMVLEAFERSIPFEIETVSPGIMYPLVCKAHVRIDPYTSSIPWQVVLRFPRLVSPVQNGADDCRTLAIRLRALRLIRH